MALPKLMRDIFANEGAGPLFRKDRIPAIGEADVPSIFVKVAKQTFTAAQQKQARDNIGAEPIPPGTMIAFGGKSVPDGWLLCNGALVSRTTYAKLFAAIGTAWGAGDGSTTFKLPDADGRVMQGVTDVSKVGKYLEAGLPNTTGVISAGGGALPSEDATGNAGISGDFYLIKNYSSLYLAYTGDASHVSRRRIGFDASRSCGIYSSSATVQPKAFQTLIIIKV